MPKEISYQAQSASKWTYEDIKPAFFTRLVREFGLEESDLLWRVMEEEQDFTKAAIGQMIDNVHRHLENQVLLARAKEDVRNEV